MHHPLAFSRNPLKYIKTRNPNQSKGSELATKNSTTVSYSNSNEVMLACEFQLKSNNKQSTHKKHLTNGNYTKSFGIGRFKDTVPVHGFK